MKTPIIVAPNKTPATRISFQAAQYVEQQLRARGYNPICLYGVRARKPFLRLALQKTKATEPPPHLVVYFGHGEPDFLVGSDFVRKLKKPFPKLGIVAKDYNDYLLSNCIVVAHACYSLRGLGPAAVDKGAVAYLGFDIPVWVNFADLDEDGIADVTETLAAVVDTIALGGSVGQAYDALCNVTTEFISLAETESVKLGLSMSHEYINVLNSNLRGWGMVGNQNAVWI